MTMNKLTAEVLVCCIFLGRLTLGLLQCRSCSNVHSLEHCRTETCQSNELCYVGDTGHLFTRTHSAHCMLASTCRTLTHAVLQYYHYAVLGRKRSIHLCDICCGDSLCNSKPCNEVRHEIYHLYKNNQFDMQTLSRKVTVSDAADSDAVD